MPQNWGVCSHHASGEETRCRHSGPSHPGSCVPETMRSSFFSSALSINIKEGLNWPQGLVLSISEWFIFKELTQSSWVVPPACPRVFSASDGLWWVPACVCTAESHWTSARPWPSLGMTFPPSSWKWSSRQRTDSGSGWVLGELESFNQSSTCSGVELRSELTCPLLPLL